MVHSSTTDLTDRQVLAEVKALASQENDSTPRMIVLLAEVDARKLYRAEGCPSLFIYCTRVLRLSEPAAYARIAAARAGRCFPIVLERLVNGSVNLTTVCLLAPHLTEDNNRALLDTARGKTKREVEQIVAAFRPRVDDPATVTPVAKDRFRIRFTVDRDTHDELRYAQDLARHAIPDGNVAEIFKRSLKLFIVRAERSKFAAAHRPRHVKPASSRSRHIPAAVRRAVWQRDGGCCAFVGTEGRCGERAFLEFHHVFPYADGGGDDESNIQLRCRAHNQHEADQWFGEPERS